MTVRQKYLFVINPVAGDENKLDLVELIEERSWQVRPHILWTEIDTQTHLPEVLKEGRYDAVVAVGGDGTVHMVANALVGTGIPMGVIPMGSGNGLAKDLNLPLGMMEAFEALFDAEPSSIDTIDLNGKYSFHICDAGLNAHVVREYAQGSFRTIRAYAWQLLKYYFGAGAVKVRLWLDGVNIFKGEVFMVALCNGQRFGSDIIINPAGIVDDGLLEVVILRDFPKTVGPSILLDLMAGELDPAYFERFQGKNFRFISDKPLPWQVDGEYCGMAKSFKGSVLPGLVSVLREVSKG